MTKIFISIPWFFPAFRAGGPIQSVANLVNHPANGYEYLIFCGDRDLNDEALPGVVTDRWTKYNAHTQVYYSSTANRFAKFKEQVNIHRPVSIFVIGLFSWQYNILPLLASGLPKRIISVRGMLHPGALSQKQIKKKIFISLFKIAGIHKKFAFHATDEAEADCIKKIMGADTRIFIAGNFPRLFDPAIGSNKVSGQLKLVCLALISPMKNHLLVLQALKKVTQQVVFHIAGPVKDPVYWQECEEMIRQLPPNISVEYHGDISPDLVGQWLVKHGDVFIMPSKSENFGHSIIEALSAGLPVITSRFTPWNNLEEKKAGVNVELDPAAIQKAIDYFADMNAGDISLWKAAASAYAIESVNTISLWKQYKLMFESA